MSEAWTSATEAVVAVVPEGKGWERVVATLSQDIKGHTQKENVLEICCSVFSVVGSYLSWTQ